MMAIIIIDKHFVLSMFFSGVKLGGILCVTFVVKNYNNFWNVTTYIYMYFVNYDWHLKTFRSVFDWRDR